MTELEFQNELKSTALLGEIGALRRVVSAGAAAGYSVDMPLDESERATALHHASRFNNVDVIEALIECGASVNARDRSGQTPLHRALGALDNTCGRAAMVAALLGNGASPNVANSQNEVPLHLVISAHAYRNWEAMYNSVPGPEGTKQIKIAQAATEFLPLTRLLLDAGADPDFVPEGVRSKYRTPFQLAISKAVVEQLKVFVEEGGVRASQKTLSGRSMLTLSADVTVRTLLKSYIATEAIADAIEVPTDELPALRTGRASLSL